MGKETIKAFEEIDYTKRFEQKIYLGEGKFSDADAGEYFVFVKSRFNDISGKFKIKIDDVKK